MRVFVTGATGFIGTAVVKELLGHGHQVLGLSRSDDGAKLLKDAGAEVLRGSLDDLESLKKGAVDSQGVIHLAFIHDFSKFQENCVIDKQAIEAMGSVIAGSKRPLIVTSGVAGLSFPGQLATEETIIPPNYPIPRVSEQTALALLTQGVSAAVMRLPQVHDPVKQGLVSYSIQVTKEKGMSAYQGEGTNRWAAAHVSDVATLYRLALEHHKPGAKYHAVAEEGVKMREIAEVIGQGLNVPVRSLNAEEMSAHYGWLTHFMASDLAASSAITRKAMGWNPTGPGLIDDLKQMDYAQAA